MSKPDDRSARFSGPQGRLIAVLALLAILIAAPIAWRSARHLLSGGRTLDIPMANAAEVADEFSLKDLRIDVQEILRGGPPKDGIPALTDPAMVTADQAPWPDEARVIGVATATEARAYPLPVLDYHEIVNDMIGGQPVAVTYCPLCDSAGVFDRRIDDEVLEFGVSGLLYNSNVLLYNRAQDDPSREGLWSQVKLEAVSGPYSGTALRTVPFEVTTWARWRSEHPGTLVLSDRTGHERDYQRSPYQGYFEEPDLMFPITDLDTRMDGKTLVIGVKVGDLTRAYPLQAVAEAGGAIKDTLGEVALQIEAEPDGRGGAATSRTGEIQFVTTFWFAWAAMHPNTTIWSATPAKP